VIFAYLRKSQEPYSVKAPQAPRYLAVQELTQIPLLQSFRLRSLTEISEKYERDQPKNSPGLGFGLGHGDMHRLGDSI
jgi:hypothetical protein